MPRSGICLEVETRQDFFLLSPQSLGIIQTLKYANGYQGKSQFIDESAKGVFWWDNNEFAEETIMKGYRLQRTSDRAPLREEISALERWSRCLTLYTAHAGNGIWLVPADVDDEDHPNVDEDSSLWPWVASNNKFVKVTTLLLSSANNKLKEWKLQCFFSFFVCLFVCFSFTLHRPVVVFPLLSSSF